MNAPISSQEIRFLLMDAATAQRSAGLAPDARRHAPSSALVGAARHALAWLKGWPSRHAAMRELSELSDHELADIGLRRHDIAHALSRD
jgi:uncharacterized protein YjiS (DUF1127 family)